MRLLFIERQHATPLAAARELLARQVPRLAGWDSPAR